MKHSMIERPAWNREQMAEVASLVEFIRSHDEAHRLPDDLLDACERVRDLLGGGFGGARLEQIGYAWQNRVTGVWSFRSGPQPEHHAGPQPPPRHDVFIVRSR